MERRRITLVHDQETPSGIRSSHWTGAGFKPAPTVRPARVGAGFKPARGVGPRLGYLFPSTLSGIALATLLLLLSAGAAVSAASPVAAADSARLSPVLVVVADSDAVRESVSGVGLIESFIGLLATLKEGQPVTFIAADGSPRVIGPFDGTDPEFGRYIDEIKAAMKAPVQAQSDALAYAVAEAQNTLADTRAAPGSAVYLISGDSTGANFAHLEGRLKPLAARFGENGWPINGVGLPGASEEATRLLKSVSTMSGGRLHDLSVSDGFSRLTNALLSEDAKGSLARVGEGQLSQDDLLTTVVSIAPGTRESTLLLFKESPYGSLRLSNPGGLESAAGDRSASYVLETPHAVIWRLENPVPGNWKVDARGIAGHLSAWEFSSNKYTLVLDSPGPVPLGEPTSITAHVVDGDRTVALESTVLRATLTTPEGTRLAFDMNDDGVQGDAVAGDGHFSLTLPPMSVEGQYDINLELLWLDFDHRITSQSSLEARAFPEIEVRATQIEDLELGARTQIAKVFVHVQGQPYPVSTDVMAAGLTSPGGQPGAIDLEPRRLFGSGPAWEYDVFFTPTQSGLHTLVFWLAVDYAGRSYVHTAAPVVLSSAAPPAPVVEEPEAAPPPVPAPVVPAPQLPSPPIRPAQSQFPWLAVAAPGVVVLLVAAVALFLLTRTRPYGYIYDDRDEALVDFSKVERHPVLDFFFRSTVRGKDLGIQGLEGVVFHFSGKRVKLRSEQDTPTVRVNNQPLVGQASIQHKAWIGSGGKLYSFLTLPPAALPPIGAGAGED